MSMCKQKEIKGLQNLKGLRGFWYYDVPDEITLLRGKASKAQNEENTEAKKAMLEYDSGIFSSTAEDIESTFANGDFSQRTAALPGEIESYARARDKFALIKKMRQCKAKNQVLTNQELGEQIEELETKLGRAYKPCQGKPKRGDEATAIGMVLALIASKGSAENGNSQPYIMLVRRQNKNLRNNELDAAVVEGLNRSDFKAGKAMLKQIARRALEEERGLNCEMLENLGLLHMPEKYYFGYDDEYQQWNFLGTVVVDCTIEELIREGFYFTKDKFESKGILGIPLDPQILYYHLSQKKIGDKESSVDVKMWKHGWASVLLAVRDYFGMQKTSYAEQVCLHLNRGRRMHAVWRGVRSCINRIAAGVMPRNRSINMLCAVLSALLLVMTALYFAYPERLGNPVTLLSTLITVITCWCVVALARDSVVSRKDIFYIDTNHGTAAPIFETRVFRNISLVDGNLADNPNISFSVVEAKKEDLPITVQRTCKQGEYAENTCWGIINRENGAHYQTELRFIFPLIVDEQHIVLRDKESLSHYFDFKIPYKDLVGELNTMRDQDREIKNAILKALNKNRNEDFSEALKLEDIHFHFLLKETIKSNAEESKERMVIVGFINCQQRPLGLNCKRRRLSHDLTNTAFALKFKDDATRVACEYAIAKYVGYKMESR